MIAIKDFPFDERIDVIICNPPQLPDNSVGHQFAFGAYSTGQDGRRYIEAAISAAAHIFGRLKSGARRLELVTTSVIGGFEPTLSALRSAGFDHQLTGQAEAEFRTAYYEVMHLFPRGSCRWENGRGFERIFAISANYIERY